MKNQASIMYPILHVTLLLVGLLWPGSRLAAQATPPLPPAASSPVIQLSPFEVTADNRGYQATNTMAGTRLSSKLEDLASAISVVTKEQMADFALLDLNDVFNYEAGTEGTGNFTDTITDRNGMVVDNVQNNPQGANRIRGMGAANITFNNFSTTGRVPVDPLNIDALEISRGPNSSIFGIGSGAGTVNLVGASANLSRPISSAQMRFDDLGGWRTSLDLSRPLIRNKLALRLSGAYQHDAFPQKPSGFDSKRFNAMLRAQPFKYTSLRASFGTYRGNGTRPNSGTPRDTVTYWKSLGGPTWDPVTSTMTVNGVKTVMGATDPIGLGHTGAQNGRPPTLFIDRDGIQLWMINRMPAATATNGPNNQNGTQRLMESVPEAVRTGRPLFATVPAVSDQALYDWSSINLAAPNLIIDSVNTTNVELEQFLLRKGGHQVAIQAAWHREDSARSNFNTVGQSSSVGNSGYLSVDVNERLLDGRPNPYFLRPYIGVIEGNFYRYPNVRDTYRGQLAYVSDFTGNRGWSKWLGRHQFLGYYEFSDNRNYTYRLRLANVSVPGNPVYITPGVLRGDGSANTAVRTYDHFYVGDNRGQNVDHAPGRYTLGQYGFQWFDPRANRWVTDQAELGVAGWRSGSGGRNLIKTRGAMMQNSLWQDRIVLTLGKRTDQNGSKPYNVPVMDANGIDYDFAATEQVRSVDWIFQEGDTLTKGIVVKPLRWLNLHYNESDSFTPVAPALNLAFELLGNPRTEGTDYGFSLKLFEGKLVLRFNRYDTSTLNTRNGQSATLATRVLRLDRSRSAQADDLFNLENRATDWVRAMNPSWTTAQIATEVARQLQTDPKEVDLLNTYAVTETGDARSKGDEIEVNYNPNSFWTAKLNVTRTNAFDSKLAPGMAARIAQRIGLWTSIVDPRTNTPWWTTDYGGTRTAAVYYRDSVQATLALAQATEGVRRAQVREWRTNLSTSYRLAGLSEQKHLKRTTVGGSVRWEDRGAIGYYGIPVNGDVSAATQYDKTRPIWSPANAYFDAFVSYRTRLFSDKVGARFQLNARNLQEGGRLQAVAAYPDGQPNTYRIINPRTFIFTTTFDL